MDDPDCPVYWRHRAANTRYGANGVLDDEARALLREIAEHYERIAEIVQERGPLTKRGRLLRSRAEASAGN
jgi:hypothetical protein